MNGKSVVIERRDKNGMVTFRHADYDKIMNIVETKTLSHHSMKVYVNALVHLYFGQSVERQASVSAFLVGQVDSAIHKR
jgi:hypothetical protein